MCDNLLSDLLITIIGTLTGAFLAVQGSLYIFNKQQKEEGRKRHFEKIKSEVLRPQLSNVSMSPDFPPRNKGLFNDLKNHFPELTRLDKALREMVKKRGGIEDKINDKLKQKLAEISVDKKWSDMHPGTLYTFILERKTQKGIINDLKIIGDELKSGGAVYAVGKEEELKNFKEMMIKLPDNEEINKLVNEIKKLENQIEEYKNTLKTRIEEELNKEKLDGNCVYLKD